jgi:hypothetical protein
MVEHVQMSRRRVVWWQRALVGLAVLYAALVSVGLMAAFPELQMMGGLAVVAVIALPLAFGGLLGFRIACLAVVALLVPLGVILAILGMFVYVPAALPLTLAATPLPGRHPVAVLELLAVLLAMPWAYALWLASP